MQTTKRTPVQLLAQSARDALQSMDSSALSAVWLGTMGLEWIDSADAEDSTTPETAARCIVSALEDMAESSGYAPEFMVDGLPCSLAELIRVNRDDADLCLWALSADPGERFPAVIECIRIK
jgi:hypothetical protein